MAEVLKLAARPTPYDNDERTWQEFRFKLENYLTLVNETERVRLVGRHQPQGECFRRELTSPLCSIKNVDSTHCTQLLAENCTTGQKFEDCAVLNRNCVSKSGDSWWRKTHQRFSDASKIRNVASISVARPRGTGRQFGKFEEAWKTVEHQAWTSNCAKHQPNSGTICW